MRISASQLKIAFGDRTIVDIDEFVLPPGELTIIIGPNGAGKSTLLRALAGDLPQARGRVAYGDDQLSTLAARDLAHRRAVLSQSIHVAFPFTVYEVVKLGAIAGTHGLDARQAQLLPYEALERVDLAGFAPRLYALLSGGEQQRTQLARVLCQVWTPVVLGRPRFLFLDEPSASLDIRHQLMVLDIAKKFTREGGGVLAILHDLNLAAAFADRLVVLSDGKIAAQGTTRQALTSDVLSGVFGVPIEVGARPGPGVPFVLPQAARKRSPDLSVIPAKAGFTHL